MYEIGDLVIFAVGFSAFGDSSHLQITRLISRSRLLK